MHIYVFGSVCRGEVCQNSDVDLLVLGGGDASQYDPDVYSVYSYERIHELWREGNPFAWHLSIEAKLVFSSDGNDFLRTLGRPAPYRHCRRDCEKFRVLFEGARASILQSRTSTIFDLSTIFLSIRNIATCFSLGLTDQPDFSRRAALRLRRNSVPLSTESYRILERARILCTRGKGPNITKQDVNGVLEELDRVYDWMSALIGNAKAYERI